ncbi:MAG: hypothetical protein IJI65_10460 [Lachnospiraceae bacterium]|nr:hypothetical protein [Lachnospiraceae bacterium]
MAVENIGAGYSAQTVNTKNYGAKAREGGAEKTEGKQDVYGEAAVYERSAESKTVSAKNMNVDRDALVAQLKADSEAQVKSLMDIVNKTISGQGKAFSMASGDDMWKFLASGNFTVDAETKAQAQKDIAEDGYWGVEKTSDRIVDFAKALSGGDEKKADELIGAFKKGFEQATKAWGKTLPDISQKTYDRVLEKMDNWKNGTENVSE